MQLKAPKLAPEWPVVVNSTLFSKKQGKVLGQLNYSTGKIKRNWMRGISLLELVFPLVLLL